MNFPSKRWAKGYPSDNLSVSSACSCQGKVTCSDCMWVWSPPKYDCWIRHCCLINITTVYICTEAYAQAHAHTYMHKLVHTRTHACTYKFRHTHAQIYAGTYRHAHVRVRTQAHAYVCTHSYGFSVNVSLQVNKSPNRRNTYILKTSKQIMVNSWQGVLVCFVLLQ